MLKRSIALLGARGGGICLAFVFNLLIAQQLPEADYSIAIYTYTLIVLASLIARNGNHVWIPRDMAKTMKPSKKLDVAVRGIAQTVFYGSFVAFLAFAYFAFLQPNTRSVAAMTALAIAGAIVTHAICETFASVFVGLKRPMTASVTSFILPNILLLSYALLFPVESFFEYARLLLFSYGFVAISVLIAGYALRRPKLALAQMQIVSFVPIVTNFPVTSVVLILYLNANLDIFVLGNTGTPEDMALFSFVFKIAGSISMLSVLPRMISGPLLSERHYAGDMAGVKKEFRRVTCVMAIFGILAGAAILIFFPYLTDLVGKYGNHGGVLYVILIGSVLNVMFGPLLLLLNMTENNQFLWKYGGGFFLVKIALLFSAYQYLNLFWFAAVGALMVFVWNILLYRLAALRLKA